MIYAFFLVIINAYFSNEGCIGIKLLTADLNQEQH